MYRDIVLDCIDNVEKSTRQLYIAGDNWYNNIKKIGDKDFKVYLTDILRTGYSKLYSMNKEVYIAVGNHDQDSNTLGSANDLRKDCNINTQKYYLQHIKAAMAATAATVTASKVITEPTLESLQSYANDGQFKDDVLCEKGTYIYVDNIGVRYNKNNIVIIINTNNFDDFATGKRYLQKLKGVIKKVVANAAPYQIFVMGHIPLFSFKNDTIAIQEINKDKLYYRAIILQLYDMLAKHNIIYICADTHHFSIMEIKCGTKVVMQITAGTGGADPDVITENHANTPINRQLTFTIKPYNTPYNIKAFALNPYGYVNITINPTNIEVCYKKINIVTDTATAPVPTQAPVPTRAPRSRSSSSSNDSGTSVEMDVFTYQINRNMNVTSVLEYVNTTTGVKTSIVSNYKSKKICKNIANAEKGYVTDDSGSLLCYMKVAKEAASRSSRASKSVE